MNKHHPSNCLPPATSAARRPGGLLLPALAAACSLLVLQACSPPGEGAPRGGGENRAKSLAQKLDADFSKVLAEAGKLAEYIRGLYEKKAEILPAVDRSLYAMHPNGSFYKTKDDGGAALWISGAVPITEEVKEVAYFTEPLDAELIRITRQMPEVQQAYYNDKNSLNRIYPWFDVIAQYPPKMNIPDFNFYFLADAEHNPEKRPVWVNEPYVDPAGRGWMVSAIAPVYFEGELVGVPGLDVTISDIVDRYLDKSGAALAVVAPNGVLVAATEKAITLLEMPPLKDHKYIETVKQDTYKPEEYDLLKSPLRPVRQLAQEVLPSKASGSKEIVLGDKPYRAYFEPVPGLGWTVFDFVPR